MRTRFFKKTFLFFMMFYNISIFAKKSDFWFMVGLWPKVTYQKDGKVGYSLDLEIARPLFFIPLSYEYSTKWGHKGNVIIGGLPFFSLFKTNNFPYEINAGIAFRMSYYFEKSSIGFEAFHLDFPPIPNVCLTTGVRYIRKEEHKVFFYIGFLWGTIIGDDPDKKKKETINKD